MITRASFLCATVMCFRYLNSVKRGLLCLLILITSTVYAEINQNLPVDEVLFTTITFEEQQKMKDLIPIKAGMYITKTKIQESLEILYKQGEFESINIRSVVDSGYHDLSIEIKAYPIIEDIEFKGFDSFSKKALIKLLESKIGQRLNMNTLQKDNE